MARAWCCPPCLTGGARTATEHFIESLLRELGEACDEVEYWGRDAWQPVPAHADIDERCSAAQSRILQAQKTLELVREGKGDAFVV